ncbi:Negative transcriptional regulator [Candidatus Sulfotelmatomonas gaucii]|uniref:Negative transcriptional regulator n=1 Tax=Candidatus Sulfuritelmatomonas gaucii TaxID=2043161 RepID=A0A2N9L7I7_9BACT|nr:Negative transcriptional regulator [Candidatus Sulfotelmatomonas gaucii]
MYTPKFNRVSDHAILLEAMRENSFAILFGPLGTSSTPGAHAATHLPLMIKDEGEHGLIEGHFAAANPHWKALAGRKTLVVFAGAHSYVSPTCYTEALSVPTWNYIAVHAYGILSLVEGSQDKERLVTELIVIHEPGFLDRWREFSDGFRRTMLAGIKGFRIPIERIEGKFKLSQNRTPEERRNVLTAHAAGTPDQQELARWMQRLADPGLNPRDHEEAKGAGTVKG